MNAKGKKVQSVSEIPSKQRPCMYLSSRGSLCTDSQQAKKGCLHVGQDSHLGYVISLLGFSFLNDKMTASARMFVPFFLPMRSL